jgi:hypothetical protein
LRKLETWVGANKESTAELNSVVSTTPSLNPFPPVLLDEFPEGNVVGYGEKFYYIPKSAGNVEVEKLDDTSEVSGLKTFINRSDAFLYGLHDTYVRQDNSPTMVGTVMGYNIVSRKSVLYSINRTGKVIALDRLTATELPENQTVHKHPDIIDLLDKVVRIEKQLSFNVASTSHHYFGVESRPLCQPSQKPEVHRM